MTVHKTPTPAAGVKLVLTALGIGLLVTPVLFFNVLIADGMHWNDFGTFFRGACGSSPYAYDALTPRAGETVWTNLNPPHFHLLLTPLCGFTPGVAYGMWMITSVWCISIIAFLAKSARGEWWPPLAWLGVLLSAATTTFVATGQVTGIVGLPVVLAWWDDRHERPFRAGVWFGLALAVKPFLGLVTVWWLWRRRWTALLGTALSGAASFAIGLLIFGWSEHLLWVDELGAVAWPWTVINASVWAPWSRVFTSYAFYFTPWIVSPTLETVATIGSLSIVTVYALRSLRISKNADESWAVLMVWTLLVSPLGWTYYGWWALPMLSAVAIPRWAWWVCGICWVWPAFIIVALAEESALLTATLGNAYTIGLLALWSGLIAQVRATDRSSNAVSSRIDLANTSPA